MAALPPAPQRLFGIGSPSLQDATPAVSGGTVIAVSNDADGGQLQAFDAAGVTGCSGSPVVCTPLWTATVSTLSSPTVANGYVYAADPQNKLAAFDVAGQIGCSGTPKVCAPVWRGSGVDRVPNIAASGAVVVEVPLGPVDPVAAYDATGQSCGGAPATCDPLWTAAVNNSTTGFNGSPTIVNDRVWAPIKTADHPVKVLDATGTQNCSGPPKVCTPLWVGDIPDPQNSANKVEPFPVAGMAAGNGFVFVPLRTGSSALYTAAFDQSGVQGCSAGVCQPVFYIQGAAVAPTIAHGVLFAGANAFDAAGVQNCAGAPKICTPIWNPSSAGEASIVGGRVYVVDSFPTYQLRVYGLP